MPRKIIFIMVDGFGIPPEGWYNSFFYGISPEFVKLLSENSIPAETDLSVPGLPQSATGQTSLFTGDNAAAFIGRHVQGFPGPRLRKIIAEKNIFKKLIEFGFTAAFSNAYVNYDLEMLEKLNLKSVTTVMVESALRFVRGSDHLLTGKAVYHDITGESLLKLHPHFSLISPEKAAENMLNIASDYDFTLFEYFLTDRAGHRMDYMMLRKHFSELGRFIVEISKNLGSAFSLVLTSDHGNAEDMNIRTHTFNPVPLMGINFNFFGKTIVKIENISDLILKNIVMNYA